MNICYCNITYGCNNCCLFCAANLADAKDQKQIPLAEFRNILKHCQITESDRVVLNGGEPTVHPDFFQFCNEIAERGATIDLFTNGKKLSAPAFTKQLLNISSPLIIRIPVFGAAAESHDYLTGVPGNFEKLCAALQNLFESDKKKLLVDIKLLLSKQTVSENYKIVEKFFPMFRDKRFQLTLNHLLVSDQVIKHKDIFFMPYKDLVEASLDLFEIIQKYKINFRINMPLCLLPPQFRPPQKTSDTTLRTSNRFFYSDPNISCRENLDSVKSVCDSCVYSYCCSFFPKSYLAYYGDSEISPILQS